MDHEEAKRKGTGGKIIGFFYYIYIFQQRIIIKKNVFFCSVFLVFYFGL